MTRKHQRGQALPLGLALAVVATLGALVLYNTGRVATDKARLANAADAAAYSGLLWQARALNYQAYTNRAMVANQVSIAQAVSLRSWTAYGERTADNIAKVLGVVPPMKVYAEGVAQVMGTLNDFVGPVADAMVGVIAGVNGALSASQDAMYAASFAATPEIVRAIARESDPLFRADTAFANAGFAGNLDEWRGFTSRYEPEDIGPMRARTELINRSRDDFSRERDWRLFKDFWFYSTPLTRHKIFREGETELVATEQGNRLQWEWRAVDTLSLQNRIFRFGKSEKAQEAPIGWGAASASSGGRGGSPCTRSRWGIVDCPTRTANAAAERKALRDPGTISGYGGLSPFRSLSEERLEDARRTGNPVLRLRTEVALDTSAVRASGQLVDGELLHTDVVAPGDRLSSISAAEVFYRRPDDAADAAMLSKEGATGYNPYWDVRLSPVSTGERLLAVGLREGAGTAAPETARGAGAGLADAATGALPGYVEELAEAWGDAGDPIDLAALDESFSTASGITPENVGALADGVDHAEAIGNGLKSELRGVVDRILSGAGRASVGAFEDAARSEIASVGDAIDSAQGVYDVTLASAGEVARGLEEKLGAVTDAADGVEETLDGLERDADAARDALGGAGAALDDAVGDAGARMLGDLDVAAFESRIDSKIRAATEMAVHMNDVRREVARRMNDEATRISKMARERMLQPGFDSIPYGLAPHPFKGYDIPLLLGISTLMANINLEVDPEIQISEVMIIEAAKFYYTEHVNLLRHDIPLTPTEANANEEEADAGQGDAVEDGQGGEGEIDVPEPYEDGTDTPWETPFEEGE